MIDARLRPPAAPIAWRTIATNVSPAVQPGTAASASARRPAPVIHVSYCVTPGSAALAWLPMSTRLDVV
jgi:hypothetical protein